MKDKVRKDTKKPEFISLSEEFFGGKEAGIEVKAKVLYGGGGDDIISQYVSFSKAYTEQVRLYGCTRKAALEAVRICMDKNVLAEYLRVRESEVVSIMMTLFDEEYIQRAYHKSLKKEALEEARAQVEEEARKAVRKAAKRAAKEAEKEATKKEKRSAQKLYQMGVPVEHIAEASEVSIEVMRQWLGLQA